MNIILAPHVPSRLCDVRVTLRAGGYGIDLLAAAVAKLSSTATDAPAISRYMTSSPRFLRAGILQRHLFVLWLCMNLRVEDRGRCVL
jgi:hypothetical protein